LPQESFQAAIDEYEAALKEKAIPQESKVTENILIASTESEPAEPVDTPKVMKWTTKKSSCNSEETSTI
jgi:hypothetical protein